MLWYGPRPVFTRVSPRPSSGLRLGTESLLKGARRRRTLQVLVVLAAGVLVAGLSPASGDSGTGSGSARTLPARGTSLAQREHAALLDLYVAESQLAAARATVASTAARQASLDRERQSVARRAAIIRGSLRVAEARIGQALRDLYIQGQLDPIAIFLGATSLDQAVNTIDTVTRSARQNQSLVAEMHGAQIRLRAIDATLAARSDDLAAARAQAEVSAAKLRLGVGRRRRVISSIVQQRDITRRAAARLVRRARAAQQRSARLAAPPAPAAEATPAAPAPAAAPAPTPPPAPTTTLAPTRTPTTPARTGTRPLLVDAVAYHLSGTTASGLPAGVGVIAVDPSVIPLGTRVFIPGYGPAVAADVGSAIVGNIIDLWMPTIAQARAWGRRTVTITIYG